MDRTHYIFVDFENVSDVDLDLITGKPVVVILVLGERHKRLPLELVKKVHKFSAQVRLVETRAGRNALDFVLVYHLAVQSVADSNGYFHILSRDRGFDALILHLKDNEILASRHEVFARIPVLLDGAAPVAHAPGKPVVQRSITPKTKSGPVSVDRVQLIRDRFAANKLNRPKRKKTLLSHMHTHFGKRLSVSELEGILEALISQGAIEILPRGQVVYKI